MSQLNLQRHRDGVVLPLRVHAGAASARIRGIHDGSLKVSVTAAPEKGKANKAVLKLLSEQLGFSRSLLSIEAGATSSLKQVLIREAAIDEVGLAVEKLLAAK